MAPRRLLSTRRVDVSRLLEIQRVQTTEGTKGKNERRTKEGEIKGVGEEKERENDKMKRGKERE